MCSATFSNSCDTAGLHAGRIERLRAACPIVPARDVESTGFSRIRLPDSPHLEMQLATLHDGGGEMSPTRPRLAPCSRRSSLGRTTQLITAIELAGPTEAGPAAGITGRLRLVPGRVLGGTRGSAGTAGSDDGGVATHRIATLSTHAGGRAGLRCAHTRPAAAIASRATSGSREALWPGGIM
jgi:hypothetical protein